MLCAVKEVQTGTILQHGQISGQIIVVRGQTMDQDVSMGVPTHCLCFQPH